MKKIKLLLLITFITGSVFAQEKGHYISISAGSGFGGLNYDYKGISSFGETNLKIGGNVVVDYTYYFHKNWGIGVGVGGVYQRTSISYSENSPANSFYNLGMQIDPDGDSYDLRVRLMNWEELQEVFSLDIPVMLRYQAKFGQTKRHGMYFGIGTKLQIPINSKYKVIDGDFDGDTRLNISGFYNQPKDLELGYGAGILHHGFGNIDNPKESLGWNGNFKLKPSIVGTAELGGLFGLNKRFDLLVGVYLDYGFNNIKRSKNKELLEAPEEYLPAANYKIGNGIEYNGILNSNTVDKINTISYGMKVGLKIKLGKIGGKDKDAAINMQENMMREMLEEQRITNAKMQRDLEDMHRALEEMTTNKDGLSTEDRMALYERVYFGHNSYTLTAPNISLLDYKVQILKNNPEIQLKVVGNTCDIDSEQINNQIGMQRAEAVREHLVRNGIDPSRITIESNGKKNPLVPNTSEKNRGINRRCDFEVFLK